MSPCFPFFHAARLVRWVVSRAFESTASTAVLRRHSDSGGYVGRMLHANMPCSG